MAIFGFIVFGALVGAVVRMLAAAGRTGGWVTSMVGGATGGLVSGAVGRVEGLRDSHDSGGFGAALVGAFVVVVVYNFLAARRARGRRAVPGAAMMRGRRNSLSAQRFAERRRREDEAPSLCERIPRLASLRIEFEECFGSGATKHTRRYVIGNAHALFLVPCGDPPCTDGEHDLTYVVMHALGTGETSFHGSDDCTGNIGSSACARILRFDGTAEYTG